MQSVLPPVRLRLTLSSVVSCLFWCFPSSSSLPLLHSGLFLLPLSPLSNLRPSQTLHHLLLSSFSFYCSIRFLAISVSDTHTLLFSSPLSSLPFCYHGSLSFLLSFCPSLSLRWLMLPQEEHYEGNSGGNLIDQKEMHVRKA